MSSHRKIAVSSIDKNPHRNFSHNPIDAAKVAELVESIGRTGFWDNVVVRPHPTKPGRYELAYGHNRLAAIKKAGIEEVMLPVRDLSDWDMYCAMVDENETQGVLTTTVAYENVTVGAELAERAFRAIGPKGTLADFNQQLGRSAPAGAERRDSDHGFEKVRSAFFAGEGIGRSFLVDLLPCGTMRRDTITAFTTSRYGQQRAEAKHKEAEAKRREAEAKRKKAEAEADLRLPRRPARNAEKAEAEADALEKAAKDISRGVVHKDILRLFEAPKRMVLFRDAVKKLGIPAKWHQQAANEALHEDLYEKKMESGLRSWWYVTSGARAQDSAEAFRLEKMREFERRYKRGDFDLFASEQVTDFSSFLAKWRRETPVIIDNANLLTPSQAFNLLDRAEKAMTEMANINTKILNALRAAAHAEKEIRPNNDTSRRLTAGGQ